LVSVCCVMVYGQSKVNITSTMPSGIDLCGQSEAFSFNVRNITTGTVTGQSIKLSLPTGMYYVKGSINGTGTSEKSTSNLQYPEFNLPDLNITQSVTITLDIIADCGIESFLTSGGLPIITAEATYSGGTANHKTLPLSIQQPSINVISISNQFYTGDLKETFVRVITIKNSGKGAVRGFKIEQIPEKGIRFMGVGNGTNTVSGDTFRTVFDSAHFKNIGNKDAFLSYNEEITIFDTIRIDACNQLGEKITLDWGCNGKICKTLVYSANVSLRNKAPNLVFVPSAQNSTCFDPSIPSPQQLIIVNTGNDTARNVAVEIFQSLSGGFNKTLISYIDTSVLTVRKGLAGTKTKFKPKSVQMTNNSGALSCLPSNPVGYMELDLMSIAPGDSIVLNWTSNSCCTQSCISYLYVHRWRYKSTYKDQCDLEITKIESWGGVGYGQYLSFTPFTPTDINDGDTAKYIFNVTNAYFMANTSNSVFDLYFELPSGIKHTLKTSDFQFSSATGQTWSPSKLTMVGDSVHAQFKGKPTITLIRSELVIKVIGDCSQSSTNSDETYSFSFNYTPNTTCTNPCQFQMVCISGKIRVHCDNRCPGGLKFGDFDSYRISYGKPDNNNDGVADATGSLDMDKIKTERVMYGDTLLTVFRGRINNYGSVTTWTRLTASSYIPYGKFLEVGEAKIRILRSNTQLYKCDVTSTYTTSGNNRTFNFDLGTASLISSGCPLYSGFNYRSSDSVELHVKYVVATNPGNLFAEIAMTNVFYLHTVANPAPYQRYQCDTFSGKFMLAGYYFTNYGRGIYKVNGCNDIVVSQNYYLSVGNCCGNYAGGNLFPFEYRKWAKPDKLMVIPPKGFSVIHSRLYDYRTTGTGTYQYQYQDTLKNMTQNGDTVFYDVSGLFDDKGGSFKISDDGFFGVWYIKLRPNCAAREGKSFVRYGFDFQKYNYLGSGKERVFTASQNDQIEYSAPVLGFNTLSDDISADSDTAIWQVVIDNSSPVSLSKNVWLAAQDKGNSQIVEIIDVATMKPLTSINDVFQLGDLGPGKRITLLVKATFIQCYRDSFNLYLGHDCDTYPDSLGNARCISNYRTLAYTPKTTLLESSINSQDSVIDLCAFNTFSISVRNLAKPRAYDLTIDLFLRDGMILKDTAYVFIPGSSDSVRLLNPTDMGGGQYRWDISQYSAFLDTNGLAGVTSNDVNEYTLKFQLSTDCDFVSSTYFLARPGGKLRCGKEVLTSFSASKTMDIKGIVKPYFSHLKFEKKPIDICNYDGDSRMSFINLGPDTTGVNDYIQLLLPKGIYLDTTYMVGERNTPLSKPTIRHGVRYTGLWKIPNGVGTGDSVVFKYRTYVNPAELDCGTTQIVAQSVVAQPALCVKDSTICDIDVSTSSDLLLDSVKKGIYQLTLIDAISKPKNSAEEVNLTYSIGNTGSIKEAGILMQVKVVADTNGNGKFDVGEPIVARDSILLVIATGQTLNRSILFPLASKYACNLLLVVDSTNCVCSQTTLVLNPIRLINAGIDTLGCSRVNLPIGTSPMTGATYNWKHSGVLDPDSSKTYFNFINATKSVNTYQVILETNRGSCSTTDTVEVTLYPAIIANLQDSADLCVGDQVIIGDFPTGGVGLRQYQWSPLDSLGSPNSPKTQASPTQSTLYNLSIIDAQGCEFKDSTWVSVHQIPDAQFTFRDTCVGLNYWFVDQTTAGGFPIDSIIWDFDNGSSFTNTSPSFTPVDESPIRLKLTVFDGLGCMDTASQLIQSSIFQLVITANLIPS